MRRRLMLAWLTRNGLVGCRGVASCFGNEVEPFYNQVRQRGAAQQSGGSKGCAVAQSKAGAAASRVMPLSPDC